MVDCRDNYLVGFGKHRHLTFKELVVTEPGYVKWMMNQGNEFQITRPELYDYLLDRGFGIHNSSKSSKNEYCNHDKIQSFFLDDEYVQNFLVEIFGDNHNYQMNNKIFEDASETDVVIEMTNSNNWFKRLFFSSGNEKIYVLVEIKTIMGDDYAQVLRQMRKQKRAFIVRKGKDVNIKQVLLLQKYSGSINFDKIKDMFGDITVMETNI